MSNLKWHHQRIKETLQREIAWTISHKVNDPSVGDIVTVTDLKLAPDTRNATVFVSVYGDDRQKKNALAALNHAAAFIQKSIAPRITIKNFPRLYFKIDVSAERSEHINTLLGQLKDELEQAPDTHNQ